MNSKRTLQIILLTFFGMLGSLIIGFIFFNTSIFIYSSPNIQFLIAGFIGALFFGLLEYGNIRDQIYGMILLLILHLIIFTGRSLSIIMITRDIFYLVGLFLSIKIYYQFIKRNPKIKYYIRSLALALFYGLLNTTFIIVLFLIYTRAEFPSLNFIYSLARNGILIGLGLGLGIDIYLSNQKHLLSILKIKTAL